MLQKYNDFIIESQVYQLLLESDVTYSDNFRRVLSKIDNPVAKKILELEKRDLPVTANYFDIDTKRNDYLFFTPDRKAQEVLNDPKKYARFVGREGGWLRHTDANARIFERLGYVPGDQSPYNGNEVGEVISEVESTVTPGKFWVYVKFPSGQGVYNKQKLRFVDERQQLIWQKNRQDVRVGRTMKALLDIAKNSGDDSANFTARDLEIFVNLYKAQMDKFNDKFSLFEVVKGDDIHHFYQYDNYYEPDYTLDGSCMAHATKDMLSIYTDNPTVSLIIYRADHDDNYDYIVGRALLWELLDGKKFMDRVYINTDSDTELFRQYAKENGWYYKRVNNSSGGQYEAYSPEGKLEVIDISVQLKKGHDCFPYMDTIKWYNTTTGVMSSVRPETGLCYYCEDTDGGYDAECRTCRGNEHVECPECNGTGEVNQDGEQVECPRCEGNCDITCPDCENADW